MKNSRLALILVLFFCLIMVPQSLFAQGGFKGATAEDVALSFYKTANTMPNFEEWAKKSPGFRYQSVTEAPIYIEKEKERLLKKWIALEKDDDVLNIRTIVPLHIDKIVDEKGLKESHVLKIMFPNLKETYFPYKHNDNIFAIIIPDLNKFFELPISEEQANLVMADLQTNKKQEVVINFFIKPYKSYTDKPRRLNKADQWVMLGNIVSLTISSKKTGTPLWHYGAKWYISPKGKELRDIYKERVTP